MSEKSSAWEFDLFVVDNKSLKAQRAYDGLKRLCEKHLANNCIINVIDIAANPKSAVENQIVATPTTVRRYPLPERIIIGIPTDITNVALKLEIK